MTTPTREELLKLAKKSGASEQAEIPLLDSPHSIKFSDAALERFAALHAEWLSDNQAQGEQEPAGYMMVHVGGGDKGFAWSANSELFGPTWKRVPLYLAPRSCDQVWNEAVEASAKACEPSESHRKSPNDYLCEELGIELLDRAASWIRSIKRPLQAKEPQSICEQCSYPRGHMVHTEFGTHAYVGPEPSASGAVDSQPSTVTDERVMRREKVRAFESAIKDFVGGYEVDSGEGVYVPNEHERFLIEDAIRGALHDDDLGPAIAKLVKQEIAHANCEMQPSTVTDALLQLPEPEHCYYCCGESKPTGGFTDEQMREYARAAVALSRAQTAPTDQRVKTTCIQCGAKYVTTYTAKADSEQPLAQVNGGSDE